MICGQPKIVLKVHNLEEIEELVKEAEALGIVAEVVRDAGKTQVCVEIECVFLQVFVDAEFLI